jgi:hypothetical protein
MDIEPIGLITIAVGFLVLLSGPNVSLYLFWCWTLLGSAAAVILPAFGGASIPPAHLLLAFMAARAIHDSQGRKDAHDFPSSAAIPLLITTVAYGLIITILAPRLFLGDTDVFAINRNGQVGRIMLIPLAPVSGNFTQSLYFLADLVCFIIFCVYANNIAVARSFALAGITCAIANFAFAAIDLITYGTGTQEILSFIRNANYAMLNEAELGGLKRITGSFTEASAFAATTLWLFAFTSRLWVLGVFSRMAGITAALSLICLLLATSTTGYAGLIIYALFDFTRLAASTILGRGSRRLVFTVVLLPLIVSGAVIILALNDTIWTTVLDIFRFTFLEKASSDSGVERASWNAQAVQNVIDTYGLGVGIGSTRTSSWVLAVLASLGIPGSIFYFGFVVAVLFVPAAQDPFAAKIQSAASSACVALLIVASIGSPFVDLGLPFFMLAAFALGTRLSTLPGRGSPTKGTWRSAEGLAEAIRPPSNQHS